MISGVPAGERGLAQERTRRSSLRAIKHTYLPLVVCCTHAAVLVVRMNGDGGGGLAEAVQ